ncbi:hypothetical protein PC116_g24287 [Phytophthora cactorum]|uniref:Uncharacterized protein n=1 Tax=Phytophthora cactorum TaxID=29920 RepID=A0A8T1AHG9_9STRA|nr:hypothetical protein PC114_g23191 [Phytophthora cactorum]KAG2882715.1 hypothetical protein PC117_g26168 [Phytophthora cactorum]KAG2994480.1 hypothetical protein PC120_g21978 [Phytophthora cactorum]KAG4042512.1 hypothetical protein PC123_g21998 [Phytophthora cactorum]KAG4227318.1 hypothetical protein PC116_g24287 [Phytophthora cactorum]
MSWQEASGFIAVRAHWHLREWRHVAVMRTEQWQWPGRVRCRLRHSGFSSPMSHYGTDEHTFQY